MKIQTQGKFVDLRWKSSPGFWKD